MEKFHKKEKSLKYFTDLSCLLDMITAMVRTLPTNPTTKKKEIKVVDKMIPFASKGGTYGLKN